MPGTMLGILEDAKTPRSHPLPQAAKKEDAISAGGVCRCTNNYIREQNKNHKTVGTVAVEVCIR